MATFLLRSFHNIREKSIASQLLVCILTISFFECRYTTQSYNESNGTEPQELEDITVSVVPLCFNLFYLALGILVVGSTHMFCWKLTSQRQVSRLRSQLFSAILHQDCAWFDSHDTGSLTVIITKYVYRLIFFLGPILLLGMFPTRFVNK